MKKTIFYFLLGGLFLFNGQLQAQELSKEEAKRMKALAKQYKKNPESLLKLTEEHKDLKDQNASLTAELNQVRSQAGSSDSQIEQMRMDLQSANQQLMDANARLSELSSRPPAPPQDDFVSGILFKVQLGAYEKRQINEELDPGESMALEGGDDLQKVVVGQFRDYDKAKRLKKNLIAMGVDDAWIVSYRDGVRISIDEALESN